MHLSHTLLERAQEWINQEIRNTEALRDISQVETYPHEGELKSVSWTIDGDNFMAQVVVWDTGEFEEDLANVETGQVQTRSGLLTSFEDLESFFTIARDWALQRL
ncbi:immunity protein TriTu family protein [Streptomyces sp. QTS52]